METVVILKVINAPLSELLRVVKFMLEAPGISGAGMHAAAGVDAKLQPARMDIIRDSPDSVRKFVRIRYKSSLRVPCPAAPAVVYDDIFISGFRQPTVHNGVCRGTDQFLAYMIVKSVPGIPAHGRGCQVKIFSHIYGCLLQAFIKLCRCGRSSSAPEKPSGLFYSIF